MKNNRILAYNTSRELTEKDLDDVTGAGMTGHPSAGGSFGSDFGPRVHVDFRIDL